jgi:hypothetical protein
MLPSLDRSWSLIAPRKRGGRADFEALLATFPSMPSDYREIAEDLTEYELKHAAGQYFRIWAPVAVLEMDRAHQVSRRIPGAVPIGDDGGDRVVLYLHGNEGFGLYRAGFGALDPDEVRFIASSLTDVLTRGAGVLVDDIW